jgi:formylglycine-generating enzyme required for sulfatase activity
MQRDLIARRDKVWYDTDIMSILSGGKNRGELRPAGTSRGEGRCRHCVINSHILHQEGRYAVERSFEDHPVTQVTWYGAQAYCQWARARLPTEAEWEKAARGVDGRSYPWGSEPPDCDKAQYGDCGGATVPVGSRTAGVSPYGVLDMAGNVWEWVADWYDPAYYGSSPSQNPQGPASGECKVFRGGSWGYPSAFIRASDRARNRPTYAGFNVGFRCAKMRGDG